MARTRIEGTSGNNNMNVRNGFNDVFGFGGNDTIQLLSTGDTAGNNFVDAGSGDDSVINNFEGGNEIILGTGNDTYLGLGFALGGIADIVRAGAGNDLIVVSTLLSTYFGDSGNDTFVSVGFRNTFHGGSGTDTISYEARSDDPTSIGRSGVEVRLDQGKAFTGAGRFETLISIENVRGSNNADTIVGNGGNNVLDGLDGNDLMLGGSGDDTLRGGNGNDELQGGRGHDRLQGGAGNDRLFGESDSDILIGQSGNDFLDGGAGNDTLQGDSGNDILHGGSGQDALDGGSGNDFLRGGVGKDTLIGGTGRDTFIFGTIQEASSSASSGARDIIRDFKRGDDKIDLSLIDSDTTLSGDQAFKFRSGEHETFSGTKGQLIWDKIGSGTTARTIIMGDVNGDKIADFHIELTGHMSLSATDFIL